jgi:hypothetical protein
MPLTEKVSFTAMLQSFNKVQIPKLIRWRFKMERKTQRGNLVTKKVLVIDDFDLRADITPLLASEAV